MKTKVPYFRQEKTTTCGPACVRMVIAYNGTELSETELEEVCETSWLGNTCEELAAGVQEVGFLSEVIENIMFEGLEESLKSEMPIIVLLDPAVLYGGIQGFGHFVVVIGLEKGTVYYHDPDLGSVLAKDARLFHEAWEKFSFKGIKIWKSMKK